MNPVPPPPPKEVAIHCYSSTQHQKWSFGHNCTEVEQSSVQKGALVSQLESQ